MNPIARILIFVAILTALPTQAQSNDIIELKKIVAIQHAEIMALRRDLTNLKGATDQRFKKLKVSISGTTTYYKDAPSEGYTPRSTFIWQNDTNSSGKFTGFNCPENTVNSGADYWVTSSDFHRVYCRNLQLFDSGW